jgi:hypothetical protein
MLFRILSSNWVAIPVFLVAVCAVAYLYLMGRVQVAKIGGGLLGFAGLLVLLGSRPSTRFRKTKSSPQAGAGPTGSKEAGPRP